MKNLDKIIEVRAKEILKVRRIKFILDFINYVIDKYSFLIQSVRTERGHENSIGMLKIRVSETFILSLGPLN